MWTLWDPKSRHPKGLLINVLLQGDAGCAEIPVSQNHRVTEWKRLEKVGKDQGSAAEVPQQTIQRSCMEQPGNPCARFLGVFSVKHTVLAWKPKQQVGGVLGAVFRDVLLGLLCFWQGMGL